MFDAAKTCRTCMKTDVNLVSLFDPWNASENSDFHVADALVEVTKTQVAREDGLPQCLCTSCVNTLEISYTFCTQALKVDLELRKLFLLNSSVKDEPNELKTEDDDYAGDIDFDLFKTEGEDNIIIENATEETKSLYTCYICAKKYKSKKSYLQHCASAESKLQCTECKKLFCKRKALDLHISLEHTELTEYFTDCNDTFENEVKQEVKTELEANDKLECSICNLKFETRKALASHKKKHNHSGTKCTCNECDKSFTSKSLLRRHMKLHNTDRPYKCVHCDKRYCRADQLKDHLRRHSGVKTNVCPYCNKAFGQLCNLRDHIRTHTGETPFLCSECGKGFNNGSNLRQHMQRHKGLKPFSCTLCPKKFCTKGQMTVHMDTHTGAHPYKCEQCGASFTKPQSLKKHSLIHLGVKPYQCDVCPKRFMVKDHLTRHQRIHSGEKPYRCEICSRAFTQSNDMTKHLRTHVGLNVYQCTICDQRFRTQSELKKHYPVHYINGLAPELSQEPEKNTCTVPHLVKISRRNDSNNVVTENCIQTQEQGAITITYNPAEVDRETGIAGSITIRMT